MRMENKVQSIIFILTILLVSIDSRAQNKGIKIIQDGVEIVDFEIYGIDKDSQVVLLNKNAIDLVKWGAGFCDGFIVELTNEKIIVYEKNEFMASIDPNFLDNYISKIKNSYDVWYLTIDHYPYEKNISEEYDQLVNDLNTKDAVIYQFKFSSRGAIFNIKHNK